MDILDLTKEQKVEIVKRLLESAGHVYEHPTLILEGRDGWLRILTPHRAPHQALVHLNRNLELSFWTTVPELIT